MQVGEDLTGDIHDLDVTVWVGKGGIAAVTDELAQQLSERDLVKVRFLRSAMAESSPEELAGTLARRVDADVVDTRGHTAVLRR